MMKWTLFLIFLRQLSATRLNNDAQRSLVDSSSSTIEYWNDYAIRPLRCIVYNNVDVIMFTLYEKGYQHCSTGTEIGTYITPVGEFIDGYLDQLAQAQQDQGYEYQEPSVAQYKECTPFQIQNQYYYMQLGCSDVNNQKLAVNIYEDNTCTIPSTEDGYNDANIDVSAIKLKFGTCEACVYWPQTDGDVDDQFYEQRQQEAPLCQTAYYYKQACGNSCQRIGAVKPAWTTPEKIILGLLSIFGVTMLTLIVRKRNKMAKKDTLMEEAAMNAVGIQPAHVGGVCFLIILIIAILGVLTFKKTTWAMMLIFNILLFAYMMKLTIESSMRTQTIIGPDGEIVRRDSDDDSSTGYASSKVESTRSSHPNNGTYSLPALT